jgi:hypothetical protein
MSIAPAISPRFSPGRRGLRTCSAGQDINSEREDVMKIGGSMKVVRKGQGDEVEHRFQFEGATEFDFLLADGKSDDVSFSLYFPLANSSKGMKIFVHEGDDTLEDSIPISLEDGENSLELLFSFDQAKVIHELLGHYIGAWENFRDLFKAKTKSSEARV